MTNSYDIDDAIARVLSATTSNFVELTKIAGLDPAKDFRHANLGDINFSGCNLSGFDFSGSSFAGATFANARIAGATFSAYAELEAQLSLAVDADRVLRKLQPTRRGKRGGKNVRAAVEASASFQHTPSVPIAPFQLSLELEDNEPKALYLQSDSENLRRILDWLDTNAESPEAGTAILHLARLNCDPDEVALRARRWLKSNATAALAATVLTSMLKKFSENKSVRDLALWWIDEQPSAKGKSWSRLSEQNIRVDKWNVCRG